MDRKILWHSKSAARLIIQRSPSRARRIVHGYRPREKDVFECQYRTDGSGIMGQRGSPRDPTRFWDATNTSVAGERQKETGRELKWIRDTHQGLVDVSRSESYASNPVHVPL